MRRAIQVGDKGFEGMKCAIYARVSTDEQKTGECLIIAQKSQNFSLDIHKT